MNRPVTAIVAAMAEELSPLLRGLKNTRRDRRAGLALTTGTLEDHPVVAVCTGEGETAAERGVATLLDERLADRMVIIGVSGGLCPSLEPGSLIAGRSVMRDGIAAPGPDTALLSAVLRLDGVTEGTLVTTREILVTASSKADALRTVEGDGPAAVDLETYGYATAAARTGIPWVAVRAICDTASEDLPLDFNQFVGEDGRIRRERVALHAMRHPSLIPGLRHMQSRLSLCADRLGKLVAEILRPASEVEA